MHIQKQSIIKYLSNERQNSHYKKTTFSPQKQTLQGSELATTTGAGAQWADVLNTITVHQEIHDQFRDIPCPC